ncbi:hypothetical protein [Rubellimicrobium thermophilum]|uniref:hypothetical protein n=1 Tax=Rubellimicrobium thermophilum TaxID=295419 RepID=UPI000403A39A|nr:hypothetical protein [Rubellimicrobium thermophilum]
MSTPILPSASDRKAIEALFAEADFRKFATKQGPLNFFVEAGNGGIVSRVAAGFDLSETIRPVEVPETGAPQPFTADGPLDSHQPGWVFSPRREEELLERLRDQGFQNVRGI